MDRKRLANFRAATRELDMIEGKIERLKRSPVVTDIVHGSDKDFPYCLRSYRVCGIDERQVNKLRRIYMKRQRALMNELIDVENWLRSIEDSTIRQLIECRYIDGLTWEQAAQKVYGTPSGDAARMVVKRFLEKN